MSPSDLEKILFLDIETVPLVYAYSRLDIRAKELWDRKWQYQKELDPEQQYQKAGIYAEFAKIICVGLGAFVGGRLYISSIQGENEAEILQKLSVLIKEKFNTEKHLLCAHNGKEFDFPFLGRRFLINGIPLPAPLQMQGKKPWEIRHLDTMEMWKFGDYKNYSSLNLLSHVFGIPSPKDDMDGSMVAKVFYEEKGGLNRISTYCRKDVVTLARVFCRLSSLPDLTVDQIIFA